MDDSFLFEREPIDPVVRTLIDREAARQSENLLMIPSESLCPPAVLAALATPFSNKYAEGYPSLRMSRRERARVEEDSERYLAFHRRYGDRRFYKGTEFCNLIEAIAQHRCAELFARPTVPADEIFVNVQPLSGAPANNAVFEALLKPLDVIMGMHLSYGGHLTHGSPFNRSGKYYTVKAYVVNRETGRFDYDAIRAQAREAKPKLIVAGASAYPWTIDWTILRNIADEIGAYLLADISHPAGLVAAGLFPNPVGVAHVTMFTTHKTLCGPRGAVLLSTDPATARKIDSAVFPGEQGGPHVHVIAAKAVAFKLAATDTFEQLMKRIVENAAALADGFRRLGLPLAYGGTDTHLCLIDLRKMDWKGRPTLTADIASNILDLCGITCNKNALPGDETGVRPSGLRFGTVVLSQRGMGTKEMNRIAQLVHRVLTQITPFKVRILSGPIVRGKIDYEILREVRQEVRRIAGAFPPKIRISDDEPRPFEIRGERARVFLSQTAMADMSLLKIGSAGRTRFLDPRGKLIEEAVVFRTAEDRYTIEGSRELRDWLTAVSDGYIWVRSDDIFAKVHGPVAMHPASPFSVDGSHELRNDMTKPFVVGESPVASTTREIFSWNPPEAAPRKTPLYSWHKNAGARMLPFAGYSMPGWYTTTAEEHRAVRTAAGLFDVAHMGVFEFIGESAVDFLDTLTANFVHRLEPGESQYSYVLDTDGQILDDVIIYRMASDRLMMVVNASNQDKLWAWFTAVNERRVLIDRESSAKVAPQIEIRNLKAPSSGADQRVDLAFQGRAAKTVLERLIQDPKERKRFACLSRFEHNAASIGPFPAIVSRTGYTGEDIGYEIFVHPDRAVELWDLLLETGKDLGVRPVGLGARDSTRAEAGFPLYGHELAGRFGISPAEAGYGGFVKRHKPFFVGRTALLKREAGQKFTVVRFAMTRKDIRMVRPDHPVAGSDGRCIGYVTSCVMVEKQQIGLTYVPVQNAKEGTPLGVFIQPHKDASQTLFPLGEKLPQSEEATVLSRFATFKK